MTDDLQADREYQDADGYRIVVSKMGDEVEFFPQGGGFLHRMNRAEFDQKFTVAQPAPFARVNVTGDWLDDGVSLPAYSDGRRWNGWAMPYFTREEGTRLATLIGCMRFDADRDAFVARLEGDDEDYVFASVRIHVDAADIVAYPIGAGCWCWEDADEM
ncbi:hypothetical protein LA345_39795 (plasmid) [Burkholderia vietnamiensis]|uniref:Uncharacterized protein n=1 Tax=Burkholderia vietnamiensis (strain G4 / LMG 22486) TaxID=269482 RepID=A4JUE8_BURVG|nr:conserved hypothetical protein [Burkholderia vietnamiensis G4]MCB4349935.1 hypothetical protein [Burkholderia vietnamiensis]